MTKEVSAPTPIAEAPEGPGSRRVKDPEIQALAKLDEVFAGLTPALALRCLRWLEARYGNPRVPAVGRSRNGDPGPTPGHVPDDDAFEDLDF